MKNLLFDIVEWIKEPDDVPMEVNWRRKIIILGQIIIIDILVAGIFIGIMFFIDYYFLKLKEELLDVNLIQILLITVIFLPIIEELLFRFPLKYKRNYLIQGFDKILGGRIKERWDKIFKYFVYTLTISFGLVHLFNYKNDEILFYCLGPIIIGSQLIGGFTLSYIRIKLGFIWSTLQHGLFNLLLTVLVLLFYHNSSVINISKDEYTFHLSELMYIEKTLSSYSTKIQNETVYSIKGEDINLQKVVNSLNLEGVNLIQDVWVDIYFESNNGISNKDFLNLLKTEYKFE